MPSHPFNREVAEKLEGLFMRSLNGRKGFHCDRKYIEIATKDFIKRGGSIKKLPHLKSGYEDYSVRRCGLNSGHRQFHVCLYEEKGEKW